MMATQKRLTSAMNLKEKDYIPVHVCIYICVFSKFSLKSEVASKFLPDNLPKTAIV